MAGRRPQGSGRIVLKPNGKHLAEIRLGTDPATGRPVRASKQFDTAREANKWLREQRQRQDQGYRTSATKLTVEGWLAMWLQEKQLEVSVKTHVNIAGHVRNHINPVLGAVLLKDLTADRVAGFYARLRDSGTSPHMIKKIGRTLRLSLKLAVQREHMPRNVALDVKLPRVIIPEFQVWSVEQIRAFLTAAKIEHTFAMFALLLDSGCRLGEALALTWADLNESTGEVTVNKAVQDEASKLVIGTTKTRESRRTVRLSPGCVSTLLDHRERNRLRGLATDKQDLIFASRAGTIISSTNLNRGAFRRIVERAGVPRIRIHDLRHCHASYLLTRGVNIKAVSRRLGHKDVQTTLRVYAHVLPEGEDQIVTTMQRLLWDYDDQMTT